ncbi:unnamed protein product [Vitrella brassicaformis CCMP3155]|uniref:DNA-(apurinic or apyrimidinic site) lyase n=1 Tax=Vitrella brassicaformis (strain CCMP3155) TaxID=1169540 RepID=A0A0G4FHX2_VITBC|nr:unnamed protein product [Vitrella brassicaformis CCMP3155]|eukprot:CEM12688.1 unnamed protein product [Vitrella brassicaformis CCMP3155]
MVEGPGCKRNGERLRCLAGQRIIRVALGPDAAQALCNQRVKRVFTVGKELFIIAEDADHCLRLHFGMQGHIRLSKTDSAEAAAAAEPAPSLPQQHPHPSSGIERFLVRQDSAGNDGQPASSASALPPGRNPFTPSLANHSSRPEAKQPMKRPAENGAGAAGEKAIKRAKGGDGGAAGGKDRSLTIEIVCERDIVRVFEGTVEVRTVRYALKVEERRSLDILAAYFDFQRAVGLIRGDARRVCDIAMDQNILPGVGNMIKVEGLHNAGVHPELRGVDLSPDVAMRLVRCLRDFASIMYKREGKIPLATFMKVYNKLTCVACGTRVEVIREGHYNRLTYLCPTCQPRAGPPQPAAPVPAGAPSAPLAAHRPPAGGRQEGESAQDAIMLDSDQQHQRFDHQVHPQQQQQQQQQQQKQPMHPRLPSRPPAAAAAGGGGDGGGAGGGGGGSGIAVLSPRGEGVRCGCGVLCALRTVYREGANKGRMYYTCPKPQKAACKFFKWADENFPRCGHNKPAVLRQVVKQGPNNGRYFFACSIKGTYSCGFFEWADGQIQQAGSNEGTNISCSGTSAGYKAFTKPLNMMQPRPHPHPTHPHPQPRPLAPRPPPRPPPPLMQGGGRGRPAAPNRAPPLPRAPSVDAPAGGIGAAHGSYVY